MNREIKFRVWEKHNNSFSKLPNGFCLDDNFCLGVINDSFDVEVREYTIQEYSGVVDKVGKEIYEGDILVFDEDGKREYGYTVVFSHGKFELKMPDCKMNIDIGYHSQMVIVGNVFENPDLLK